MSFTPIPVERLPGVRVDDELGPVRVCPVCHEEWPWDGEFFLPAKYRADGAPVLRRICRACFLDGWLRRLGGPRVAS